MKKLAIFDLDGTLLNSIIDIAESMNEVLSNNNYPLHSIEEYKNIIGRGIDNLVIDSLPKGITKENLAQYIDQMKDIYGKRWMLKTEPYDGIPEMLDTLVAEGIIIAILSNKPQQYTELAVKHLLPHWQFAVVFGSRENVPIKPDPQAVHEILELLSIDKSEALFIGDTKIDIQTASASGVESVGVSWGFREVEELKKANADYIIHSPKEFTDLLSQLK